jgi:DNA-binding NtrC family response regulator
MQERILLVETNQGGPERFSRYQTKLQDEGYRVTTMANGEEALQNLKQASVDVVVVDLESPGLVELGYLQKIMDADRSVKIVLNSSDPAAELDFRSWAADVLFIVPPDFPELKSAIERVLQS